MKIANNTLSAVRKRFFEKLRNLYSEGEIDAQFSFALEALMNLSKTDYILNKNQLLSESELLKFIDVLDGLSMHKPIQHLVGFSWFCDLKFKVNKSVLVPRQETEELVCWVAEEAGDLKVLDIGTGSGCIALALKNRRPNWNVQGVDYSGEAIFVAKENAHHLNLKVKFSNLDILSQGLSEKYDIIVSNPPYIPIQEKGQMDKNVAGVDPDLALFVPNDDPLLFYREIAIKAMKALNRNGLLFFEIHEAYGQATKSMLEEFGYVVELRQDINGKDRMIKAQIA
jgi:release factor glutamine methyltransferase